MERLESIEVEDKMTEKMEEKQKGFTAETDTGIDVDEAAVTEGISEGESVHLIESTEKIQNGGCMQCKNHETCRGENHGGSSETLIQEDLQSEFAGAVPMESAGKIVGVSFRRCGKIYRFDAGELEIYPGDWVVVETIRGMELGQVMYDRVDIPEEEKGAPVKPILRKAEPADFSASEENRYLAAEAFRIGLDKIREHTLPMKLIDVDYTLDQSKIVFYFTADGRVDFRALVRDLAAIFHKRIELHQIGVRDAAKMLGGLGPCGLTVCCATFLTCFDPVSIKMAKEQGLSLNPVKISGTCGRLMCCLKYEHDQYQELLANLPPLEAQVNLPEGTGVVIELNVPQQTVIIELPSKSRVEYSAESLKQIGDNLYEVKKGQKPFQKKKKDTLQ